MLTIGQPAPDFELLNQDGKTVRLSDYRGQNVVIFAFPKANTGGCNAQACSFRDEFPRISASNAVILGLSADSPQTLKGWKQSKKLPYDLLSDPDHRVLEQWGAWGGPLPGIIRLPTATRSYWVIDASGVVADMQVGVGPQASVDKALAALAKLPQTTG
jgi:peroxiredoxin Q/BCP